MHRKLLIFGLMFVVCSIFVVGESKVPLWDHMTPGPYPVGFKLIWKYDYSRTIGPRYDFQGKPKGENARPIQIALWYPASASAKAVFMKYEEYIYTALSEMNFRTPGEAAKKRVLVGFTGAAVKLGVDPQKAGEVYRMETMAIRDAAPAEGRFPLILFAPGSSDASYSGAILAEYLAGHGYVVAACPSMGMYPILSDRTMTTDMEGLDAQARDMEFILAAMRSLPQVEHLKTGTVGFSWGGITNVVLAMRNHNIDAVVSLDGSVGNTGHLEIIKKVSYTGPWRMQAAFMQVQTGEDKNSEQDTSLYEKMKYADAWLLRFPNLVHGNFNDSYLLQYYSSIGEKNLKERYGKDVDIRRIYEGYTAACRYTLHFLDAYLKGVKEDGRGLVFLENSPEENRLPAGMLTLQVRKGIPYPPSEAEFFALGQTAGIGRMREVFNAVMLRDPAVKMFDRDRMTGLGLRLLKGGQLQAAVEILKMNTEAYPNAWETFGALAEAYLKTGNKKPALKNFQKALELIPQKTDREKNAHKEMTKKIKAEYKK
ncbi:MAG: hypothetical protein GY950_20310, partial [bacterium]|nr:hypothetical protein [bacterium]